jgi:predicted nucleic acid-binding protein
MSEPPADHPTPRVFLDTSALFAGIWSEAGGARALLQLGEAGALELLVSSEVLAELDEAIRRKAPHLLPAVTALLHSARVRVVPPPSPEVRRCAAALIHHRGDAAVLAGAMAASPDYLVTLDAKHLLGNPMLAQLPFILGTPGDALAWWRGQVGTEPGGG